MARCCQGKSAPSPGRRSLAGGGAAATLRTSTESRPEGRPAWMQADWRTILAPVQGADGCRSRDAVRRSAGLGRGHAVSCSAALPARLPNLPYDLAHGNEIHLRKKTNQLFFAFGGQYDHDIHYAKYRKNKNQAGGQHP